MIRVSRVIQLRAASGVRARWPVAVRPRRVCRVRSSVAAPVSFMAGLVNSTRVAVTLYSVSGLFTVRSSFQREYSRSLDMDV